MALCLDSSDGKYKVGAQKGQKILRKPSSVYQAAHQCTLFSDSVPEDGRHTAHLANAAQHLVQLALEVLTTGAVALLNDAALTALNTST